MGAVATKEEIIAKLEKLDKKELELNLKLKELQIQLNEMVPEEERIKVNEQLNENSKVISSYTGELLDGDKKKKKDKKSKDDKSEKKSKKDKKKK